MEGVGPDLTVVRQQKKGRNPFPEMGFNKPLKIGPVWLYLLSAKRD
jgi:hypothetical protein